MKNLRFLIGFFLFVIVPSIQAAGPDYLTDDSEPPDQVSRLATPFTELPTRDSEGELGRFSDQPFLRDLEFSLRPRFYYRSLRNRFGVEDTFAAGGSLSLRTGWWRDTLQFGVTGYLTEPLVGQKGTNRSGLVAPDGDGFFVLGQAWAKVKAGPATATLFRQVLNLPFINANDSRMIPNTFEAYQVEARPWDFLRVNFGYVTGMKARNSDEFVSMSEAAGAPQVNRGTGFAGFLLGAEDQTYLGAMTELTCDLFSCTYVQAGHTWKVSEAFELRGDVQFADQRSVGAEELGSFETQFYGAQLAASYGGTLLSVAYTGTTRGSDLIDPYGADPGFNGMMISNFALSGEQSAGVGISYDFSRIGFKGVTAFANYVYGALPAKNWEQEINATVDYRIGSGVLKNFWLRARYAHNESSNGVPIEDFRVILNYTLNF